MEPLTMSRTCCGVIQEPVNLVPSTLKTKVLTMGGPGCPPRPPRPACSNCQVPARSAAEARVERRSTQDASLNIADPKSGLRTPTVYHPVRRPECTLGAGVDKGGRRT